MSIGKDVKYSSSVTVAMTIAKLPHTIANLSQRVVSSRIPTLHRMKHTAVLNFIAVESGSICRSDVQCACQAISTVNPKSATTAVASRTAARERAAAVELCGDCSSRIRVISHIGEVLQQEARGRANAPRGRASGQRDSTRWWVVCCAAAIETFRDEFMAAGSTASLIYGVGCHARSRHDAEGRNASDRSFDGGRGRTTATPICRPQLPRFGLTAACARAQSGSYGYADDGIASPCSDSGMPPSECHVCCARPRL